uniref:Putative secreted protein n=1 Tax=Ixodes scapularis TaxID=6945 RepID=A0A4D5RZQ0_IXOSC
MLAIFHVRVLLCALCPVLLRCLPQTQEQGRRQDGLKSAVDEAPPVLPDGSSVTAVRHFGFPGCRLLADSLDRSLVNRFLTLFRDSRLLYSLCE